MKIKITEFGKRHFDSKFGGTKILDMTDIEFVEKIETKRHGARWVDGYAPFCKLVAIPNFTKASVGSMPITLENYQYIRSGYSARRDTELPVFSRWLELPVGKPKAEWLVLVLYSKEQIDKESEDDQTYDEFGTKIPFVPFDADWGIVAILGQSHPNEEPMKPETMLRNALGISEGGSGVALDRAAYLKSVEFWDKNITVK